MPAGGMSKTCAHGWGPFFLSYGARCRLLFWDSFEASERSFNRLGVFFSLLQQ